MAADDLPETLTPEQAQKLGLIPAAAPTPTPAAGDLPETLTPDQARKLGLLGPEAPKPPEDRGVIDAIAREGSNVFGLGPIFGAATDTLATKIPGIRGLYTPEERALTFEQRRAGRAAALDQAREQHPLATTSTALVRGVGEAAAIPEVGFMRGAAPLAKAATSGFGYGAATGAGEAFSHGKSAGEAAEEAAKQGVAGAVTGTALTGGARLLTRGAPKRVVGAIKNLSEDEAAAAEELVRRDNDVADALTRGPKKGAQILEKRVKAMDESARPHLDTIDREGVGALGDYRAENGSGGFKTNELVDAMEAHANQLDKQPRMGPEVKKFRDAARDIGDRWKTSRLVEADGQLGRRVDDLQHAVTPTKDLRELVSREKDPEVRQFLADYLAKHIEAVGSEGGAEARRAATALTTIDQDIATANSLRDRLAAKAEGSKGFHFNLGHGAGSAAATLALLAHSPVTAAASVAGGLIAKPAKQIIGGAANRAALSALRNEGDSEVAKLVLGLVEKGVPLISAVKMADTIREGNLKERAADVVGGAAHGVNTARALFGL